MIQNNPELIVVQKIIGEGIGELLAKHYGTATFILNCQAGQIVSIRKSVEQNIINVHKIDPESMKQIG